MEKIEKFIFKGIFGVVALLAAQVFLFFYGIDIEINWIPLIFSFVFGWPAVIIILLVFII